jgi:hypothetical protein
MNKCKLNKAKDQAWRALLDAIEKLPAEAQTCAQREWVLEGNKPPLALARELYDKLQAGEIEGDDMLDTLHNNVRLWKSLGKFQVVCEACGISLTWDTPIFFCPRCGTCRSDEALAHNPVKVQELASLANGLDELRGFWKPWRWFKLGKLVCSMRRLVTALSWPEPGIDPRGRDFLSDKNQQV